MAKKIEIIGKAIVVTDTISGLIELTQPQIRTWYKEDDLQIGKISFYDLDGTEEISGTFDFILLADAVDSGSTSFSESTFRAFMVSALATESTTDFYLEVQKGNILNHSIVHKFGQNLAVGTTYVPVASGGVYNTPQVSGATTLRIKSGGNANDTAAGSGAQEITVEGIDETGAIATETIATSGASASSATTTTFMRLYRAYVSVAGTYASSSAGSHDANIVIENGAGGTDWATIVLNGFPKAQTEIGDYTIPNGYTGYLLSAHGFVDSSKTTNLLFFKRTGILQTTTPYDAMRIVFEERLESGSFSLKPRTPVLLGSACDCGFMAKVNSTTAEVDVDFEILLVKN